MNSITFKECRDALNEVADYTDYGLRTIFSGNIIALSNVSNQVSKLNDPKAPQVVGMVKNTTAGVTKSPIRIYYADGDILTSDGFVKLPDGQLDFSKLVFNGPKIHSIHNDILEPEQKIVEHMMPVVKDDEVIAMVSVVMSPKSFENNIVPIYGFNGQAVFYVADKNTGEIVFSSDENYAASNIYDESNKDRTVRGFSWEGFVESMKKGETADVAIKGDSYEHDSYIHAIPSFNEEWVIAVVVDRKVAFSRAYGLRLNFLIVLTFEFLTFFGYVVWLLKKTSQEILSEAERGSNMIRTLASDYELVIAANLTDNEAKVLRESNHIGKIFKAVGVKVDEKSEFTYTMQLLANTFVHPEDKKLFLNNTIGDSLLDKAKEGNTVSFDFRAGVNGKFRHFTVKAVPNKEEADTVVVLGFRDTEIDYRIRVEAEKGEAQKKALLEEVEGYYILAGLAEDFNYIARINFNTWEVLTYKIDERFKRLADSFDASMSAHEAFMSIMQKAIYPDDLEFVMNATKKENIVKTLMKDKEAAFECRLILDDDFEYFKVKVVLDPKNPETVIVGLLNIDSAVRSKMKQAEQEALIQKTELLRILSEDFESIYDVNLDTGKYTESITNGSFDEPLLNTIQKDIDYFVTQCRVINAFVYGEDKRKVAEAMCREGILANLASDNSFSLDFRHVFGDRVVWYRLRVSKAGDWKNERRILIGLINNDENMKKEKENQEALEKALQMANSSNRAKTTFLNSMSHDIRTPMNAIIGFTGLAETHIDNKDKVRDYLQKITQSSEHLLALINDVLDMSRIESGKVSLNEQEESLAEIIHSLKNIVMADINMKHLNLCIDSSLVINEKIICDKLRLNQILLNILSNSIKYTGENGDIVLSVKQEKSEKDGYGAYVFTVKDNGMGMDENYLKTIFDPFTREKSATVSGIQGTGLGMSITKNLVELMGGDISVKSKKDVGTEFILAIDLKISSKEDFGKISELENERVLILSKEPGVIRSSVDVIEKSNGEIDCFEEMSEAYEAIDKANEEGREYKVILSDWHIGDSDCNANINELLKRSNEKSPVIVLSVCDIRGEETEVEKLPVAGHVNKPMFASDIYNILKKTISNDNENEVEANDRKDYSGKIVLLVEDNELNREIACELLAEMGIETEWSTDGAEAVKIFEACEADKYNLVFMDVQMPVMDGYEATRKIRVMRNGLFADIPIVAMTANAFEEDKRNAFDAGMTDHLSKPIDVSKLKKIIDTYL